MNDKERLEALHKITCDVMGVDYESTFQRSRKHEYLEPRQLTMLAASEKCVFPEGVKLKSIGDFFITEDNPIGYNYSNIIHSRKKISGFIEQNQKLNNELFVRDVYNKILSKYRYEKYSTDIMNIVFDGDYDEKTIVLALIGR